MYDKYISAIIDILDWADTALTSEEKEALNYAISAFKTLEDMETER